MKWIDGDNSFANFSEDGKYRFSLLRKLEQWPTKTATFIMLNPSTADATIDDATIRRCLGYCKLWRCSELNVVNLFALRTKSPKEMKAHANPIGEYPYDYYLRTTIARANHPLNPPGLVVCAWGNDGVHRGRDIEMMQVLREMKVAPHCLGVTKIGQPKHPLYAPYTDELMLYIGR